MRREKASCPIICQGRVPNTPRFRLPLPIPFPLQPLAMNLIQDSAQAAAFCDRLRQTDTVTIDTEFLRENTYWPKLCLIQLASADEAAAIDPLAPGMDLTPVFDLLDDRSVMKVFHSGRQDIEIFHHLSGRVPTPIFDSQVAAMVCGFGDAVSYEKLIAKLTGATIDKTSRFTDWAHRPLTDRQLAYALDDVIHLRGAYAALVKHLEDTGRSAWLDGEMAVLTNPSTYLTEPREAWRRLKPRSTAPKFLSVLREVAAWRETEAQSRDIPRNRILRDEALLEIAAHTPKTTDELTRTRGLTRNMAEGWQGEALLKAVKQGLNVANDERPRLAKAKPLPDGIGPTVELLKVLLKLKCEQHGVAQKLLSATADLERIAADDEADVPALKGWRRELFGDDALALKHGRIALRIDQGEVRPVYLDKFAPID